jgi:photosynthetic reaction center cytochrome c subunit
MSAKRKAINFVCLVLSSGVFLCLATRDRAANAQAEEVQPMTSSGSALSLSRTDSPMSYDSLNFSKPYRSQVEKTVDQSRKNIQILKGLPESQLFPLMNFVATSLGVQCNFCHVQQGKDTSTGLTKWVWESDEKPEKQTARRMMQMVLSIKASNKIDFRENAVTCYTCHRGQTQPVGIPSMPLSRSGHEPGSTDFARGGRAASPSVEHIFTRYTEALGGSAATGTKTLVLKGRREASQDRNWPNEITLAAPDKFLMVTTTPDGPVRQIVNGEKGWLKSGTDVRNLEPAQVREVQRSWHELFDVIKAKQSPGMKLGGTQKVGERDADVVEQVTDSKTERYYFDSQTGLFLRKITIRETVLMPIPEQIDFEDYRDVDGVKIPFIIRYSAVDIYDSWTRKFTEIKRNVVVEDTLFAKPADPPK